MVGEFPPIPMEFFTHYLCQHHRDIGQGFPN